MARRTITVSESIQVDRPPEVVFDYTQDYATRTVWDRSITETEVLSEEPRRVRVRVARLGSFTVAYQLFRRGDRTSAAFVDVDSRWIDGGGGSWRYQPLAGGTNWTQTNTLDLKHPRLLGWLAPFFARSLRSATRQAMTKARDILEGSPAGAPR